MSKFVVFVCLLCSASSLPFNNGKASESNGESIIVGEGHGIHTYEDFQEHYQPHCGFEGHQLNNHHHGDHHQLLDHHSFPRGGNKNAPFDQKLHITSLSNPAKNNQPSTGSLGTVDTTKEPTKLDVRFDANQ